LQSTADRLPAPDVLRRSAPGVSYFDVGGYPLAYREEGTGSPLILIHGSVNDYRAWSQQQPVFAREHRTIAVSLRHCYPEHWDGSGGDFSVGVHADDVAAFILGLQLGPVDVVGHSRGGAVAVLLALKHPDLVRRLILADPGGLEDLLPDSPEGRVMAQESAQMFARLRQDLETGDDESAARSFVDALNGAGAWDRRTREQKQVLLDNIGTGPACAERPRLTRENLGALKGPILLVTGARSPRRYALTLAAMKEHVKSVSGIVTIPQAAHSMNRENPDAFNAAVMAFLAAGGADDRAVPP
jgi:pimeloyl-ACP methyl ester carboxylesterase